MNKSFAPTRDQVLFACAAGDVASRAGRLLLELRQAPVRYKADGSPVTDADEQAQDLIVKELARIAPGVPVLAEESFEPLTRTTAASFLLVDPLDGTKEFIAGRDEFTVNIALVEVGVPIIGCIFAPARRELFLGCGRAYKADAAPGETLTRAGLVRIETRAPPATGMTALVSRSHADEATAAFLAQQPIAHRASLGSSLKFCRVAEGRADLYPRFGRTMEWDTAAGHAILEAAGGCVLGLDGAPLDYGKHAASYANEGFVAWGRPPARQH